MGGVSVTANEKFCELPAPPQPFILVNQDIIFESQEIFERVNPAGHRSLAPKADFLALRIRQGIGLARPCHCEGNSGSKNTNEMQILPAFFNLNVQVQVISHIGCGKNSDPVFAS